MPAYFDSNILISVLKNDLHAEEAARLWEAHKDRVSSILLEIECRIVLRRFANEFGKLPSGWLSSKEEWLQQTLETIALRTIDDSIAEVIRREPLLARCRSLDAIHLATALHFRKTSDEPFYFFTFDSRVAEMAKQLQL